MDCELSCFEWTATNNGAIIQCLCFKGLSPVNFYYLWIWSTLLLVSACFLFCMMMLNQTLFNERFFTTLFSFSHSNWTIDWYVSSRVLIVISVVSLVIEMSRSFLEYSKDH